MKKKIKNIAEIQIGYQFRGRIETDPEGTHKVIQIRDFDALKNLQVAGLYKVLPKYNAERYLVNKRDVLFLSRGHHNYAIPIKVALENTIAASYFFILRVKTEQIIPEYLAWFINQAPAQGYLHNLARRGTHIPIVPKSVFENLKISIPDMETQEKIVKLNSLIEKEQNLLTNLQQKRTLLIRSVCLKAAKKNIDNK
ncbi:type I restriction modification DNA specificity domain protein [bacterium BMS3Bbin08]|nr:type I restriction modification DNA specificity domain protein [bacterium BMS3Bbin08]